MTDPLAELEAADAARTPVLLLALCIPNADGTEDAEIMADQIAEMVNEERERNGGPQKPAERVGVHLWPTPQFVTAEQIQWLLDVLRDHRAGGTLLARLRAAEADRDALLARLGEADERLTRQRAHIADLERKIKHVKQRARQMAEGIFCRLQRER